METIYESQLTTYFFLTIVIAVPLFLSLYKKRHTEAQSLAISLGVMFTFIGIVLGLYNFNVNDIQGSIPGLLEGLKPLLLLQL